MRFTRLFLVSLAHRSQSHWHWAYCTSLARPCWTKSGRERGRVRGLGELDEVWLPGSLSLSPSPVLRLHAVLAWHRSNSRATRPARQHSEAIQAEAGEGRSKEENRSTRGAARTRADPGEWATDWTIAGEHRRVTPKGIGGRKSSSRRFPLFCLAIGSYSSTGYACLAPLRPLRGDC